jgi:hypothetical protein
MRGRAMPLNMAIGIAVGTMMKIKLDPSMASGLLPGSVVRATVCADTGRYPRSGRPGLRDGRGFQQATAVRPPERRPGTEADSGHRAGEARRDDVHALS